MSKLPIWQILVDRGLCQSRKDAESWIMMGKVLVNTARIDKSGTKIDENENIVVKGIVQKYVNKGGLKLEYALQQFDIDIINKVTIDCGASTGGFTDCLLQHGAKLVYAVDAGFGQLVGRLRNNEKVVNFEKTNLSDVISLNLNPKPEVASVDLSYLSLKKAVPIFAEIMLNQGDLICLVKPIFEVNNSDVRRTGEINDELMFRDILFDLMNDINSKGYSIRAITNSPITGNKGTREFFMHISLQSNSSESDSTLKSQIELSIKRAMDLDRYKK
ncbi:MAG: TlyA family RNA methyltransferase [Candidatus Delongbacteria bacterium]|nr:TlyA family RNA methyltransferase [Candidatus Delongbacteria bacterium]